MSIFMIVVSYQKEWYPLIMGSLFFVVSGYQLFNIFVLKRRRLRELQYIFYSDRLVIYNKTQEKELDSISYQNFPPITFHENLNDFGYIVIGNHEELMSRRAGTLRWGVSMKDHELMLENLPNVRKEYEFLKGLIEKVV